MLKLRLVLLAVIALCSLSFLAGCHSYSLGDDIQVEFRVFPLVPIPIPIESLHLPYVAGAKVDISVLGASESEMSELTLVSDDESVITVDSMDPTSATGHCTAHAAGTANIHVLKGGSDVFSTEISVAAPTRATLSPAGPLFVGDPIPFDAGGTSQVLVGGTATYQVQYFDGDTRLFGNGVLTATADASVNTNPETTFLFQENEWLEVSPTALGPQPVQLFANGVPLATFDLLVVDQSAVSRVAVESEDTSGHDAGDWLVVLAQSFDAHGAPIFGVSYDWNLAGEDQTGEGDLFKFPLDGSQSSTITATFAGQAASTTIEAKPGTGFVTSSNAIGCAASSRAPSGGGLVGGLAALALGAALRRRRR
jgi:MYXO-CTERM domain-containing protein